MEEYVPNENEPVIVGLEGLLIAVPEMLEQPTTLPNEMNLENLETLESLENLETQDIRPYRIEV